MILVAEIGINHNGSLLKALEMIKKAKEFGFDVVKFQKRTPRLCVPQEEWNKEKVSVFGTTTYIEYKEKIEFNKKEYDIIDQYCKRINIKWTASVWDQPSLEFITQYDIPFIKIPSACLTDDDLIIESINYNLPIVVGTGMSSEKQIDHLVSLFPVGYPLTLLHCNSSYPTPYEEINLDHIDTLKYKYPFLEVGYSGHEIGYLPTMLATMKDVYMIERHITYDKNALGTDHVCSLDYDDMKNLQMCFEETKKIRGQKNKIVYPKELEMAKKLRNI